MLSELKMLIRYATMVAFGILASKGYVDGSLEEPVIGLVLAISAYVWKKIESRK